MGKRLAGRDGFTLIEALVAFAVLAMITLAVQRAVSSAIAGIVRADDRVAAETVARTLLSSPLLPNDVSAGETRGTLNGLVWTRTLSPLGDVGGGSGSGWVAMRMTIAVATPGRGGATTLETIRLVRTEQPS